MNVYILIKIDNSIKKVTILGIFKNKKDADALKYRWLRSITFNPKFMSLSIKKEKIQ